MGFGAGMGLPNIKKNSDQLETESTVGEGTTVRITVLAGERPRDHIGRVLSRSRDQPRSL